MDNNTKSKLWRCSENDFDKLNVILAKKKISFQKLVDEVIITLFMEEENGEN